MLLSFIIRSNASYVGNGKLFNRQDSCIVRALGEVLSARVPSASSCNRPFIFNTTLCVSCRRHRPNLISARRNHLERPQRLHCILKANYYDNQCLGRAASMIKLMRLCVKSALASKGSLSLWLKFAVRLKDDKRKGRTGQALLRCLQLGR